MHSASLTRPAGALAASLLLSIGLGTLPQAWAQTDHSGHAGHEMNSPAAAADDPHAHHKHAAPSAVKRSMAEIQVAATPVVRQDGTKSTLAKELEGGKPVILAFIYTSCTTVCPVTSQILANTQDKLGADLARTRIVSISIDPEYDTPERLLAYSKKFDAKPQWQHYTGTLADSIAIQKAFGAYRGDKMNHQPLLFINGGGKKAWVQLDGFPSADEVVKEFRQQIKG